MKHRVPALAFVFFTVLINSCGQSSGLPNDLATVLQVVDGDTVVLDFHGSSETVRLIGIDTPETVHPSKPVECFGPEASAYLHSLLKPDTQVRVQRDIEARDRYSRLLVYIYLLDGTFVNDELLRQGFAKTLRIEPNTTFATQFASTQTGARDNRVGLWQAC
ncbi:MAG: thermonuclease family protein [Acidimicrobiaceae bacterium]|nr:thermonuclease family protein [Acidimicrobiaceae bacterium]